MPRAATKRVDLVQDKGCKDRLAQCQRRTWLLRHPRWRQSGRAAHRACCRGRALSMVQALCSVRPRRCFVVPLCASRPSAHLNTPPTNSPDTDIDEVDICDPTHPLFGRRFRVQRRCNRPGGVPFLHVFYTEEILLRIPASALTVPLEPPTKLTLASVADLVSTFRVATACPSQNPPSGLPSQKT